MDSSPRPRIGISACLLGQEVRFDGGHKRDPFLRSLDRFVEWTPLCPEVESGMGVPRPAMRLRKDDGMIRLVEVRSGRDRSGELTSYAPSRLEELGREGLCGFVLKKDSPTCGLERVKVYNRAGMPEKSGQGLFAAALTTRFPLLPVEEEGRLHDPGLREHFIERIFACHRLQTLFASRWGPGDLVAFHAAHKLMLMVHEPAAYLRLGRLVANPQRHSRVELQEGYSAEFMRALAVPATAPKHLNVLQHMLGYFKRSLDSDSRAELLSVLWRFASGALPLIAPLTLFAHHIRRCRVTYLAGQVYLHPYPEQLMVRS